MSEYSAEITEIYNLMKKFNSSQMLFMGLLLYFFLIMCGSKQLFFEIF